MIGPTLGHYEILELLGRGGMGEVYRARDTRLGREVALKVLPAAMAADPARRRRFEREARAVAAVRHPNIVTIHSVEDVDGTLFLTMELVQGPTLGDVVPRDGLPLEQFLDLAVPIADALAAAHAKGVTHRDLKPANIMIDETGVRILDFGLAKLLEPEPEAGDATIAAESRTREGQVLGTTNYMSPEQAEGKPVDHRSDIFSLGIILYEMATGRRPFSGDSGLAVMTAILRDAPPRVSEVRGYLPAELGRIVDHCLAKNPAARFQNAQDLRNELRALQAELGLAASSTSVSGLRPAAARTPPAAALRAAAAVTAVIAAVLAGAWWAVGAFGLPGWVFPAALAVLLPGIPIVGATAWVQARRGASSSGPARGGRRLRRQWFTWKRTVAGGVIAFAAWGLTVAGYQVLRALGIGPAASLVTAGVLNERDWVLVCDFENHTADSLLARTLKEAFTIDLSRSPTVRLLPDTRLAEALARMEKGGGVPLDEARGREVAEREGVKAVISGQINPAGAGYVLSVRLVSPAGEVLAAGRETAGDDAELLEAIDRLSQKLREDIGESLKSIRANPPLAEVTTGSMAALRKYTQGLEASDRGGPEAAIPLLREAVAVDSTFAMAWRKLGVELGNLGRPDSEVSAALTRAYRHRERLPERERYLTEASYQSFVLGDEVRQAAILERMVQAYPDDDFAWNNLSVAYARLGQKERSLECARQAFAIEPSPTNYSNQITALYDLGRADEARQLTDSLQAAFPGTPVHLFMRGILAGSSGDYDQARGVFQAMEENLPRGSFMHLWTRNLLASLEMTQGHLRRGSALLQESIVLAEGEGAAGQALATTGFLAAYLVFIDRDPARARQVLDDHAGLDWAAVAREDRPYLLHARVRATLGETEEARRLLRAWREALPPELRAQDAGEASAAEWALAMAERRYQDALAHGRAFKEETPEDPLAGIYELAETYDMMGDEGAALEHYQRVVETPYWMRIFVDGAILARSLERLGQIHETRGDDAEAIRYYTRFVTLWESADPELQPRVERARASLSRLLATEKSG